MSQVEINEADLTATSEATTEENKSETTLSEESKNTGVDYKAKLEEERARREKAEARIVELKRERKEAHTQESVEDIDDQIASIEKRMEEKLESRVREIQYQSQEQRYEEAITSIASTKDEAELITHILKHDINPTGDIVKDVRRAKILANEDSIAEENAELKKALATRGTAGGMSTAGHKVREQKQQWSAKDVKFAKAAGIDLSKLK